MSVMRFNYEDMIRLKYNKECTVESVVLISVILIALCSLWRSPFAFLARSLLRIVSKANRLQFRLLLPNQSCMNLSRVQDRNYLLLHGLRCPHLRRLRRLWYDRAGLASRLLLHGDLVLTVAWSLGKTDILFEDLVNTNA